MRQKKNRGRPRKAACKQLGYRIQIRLGSKGIKLVERILARTDEQTHSGACRAALKHAYPILEAIEAGKRVVIEDPSGKEPREVLRLF